MPETLGIIAAGVTIAGGIKSLTSSGPKAPTIQNPNPGSALGIGFNKGLSTPGLLFDKGVLSSQGAGTDMRNLLELFIGGGQQVPGSLANLRSGQQALAGNIPALRSGIQGLRGGLTDLRSRVAPGFGELTQSRVKAIRDAASESIGNLRENLAKRNVLGSSFGADTESRTRLAFAQDEERARAEAKIQEIALTGELIGQELNTFAQEMGLTEFEAGLKQQDIANAITQSNLLINELTRQLQELGVAGSVANGVASAVAQQGIAQAQLQLLTQQQAGKDTAGAISAITGGLRSLGGAFGGNLQQQAFNDVSSDPGGIF